MPIGANQDLNIMLRAKDMATSVLNKSASVLGGRFGKLTGTVGKLGLAFGGLMVAREAMQAAVQGAKYAVTAFLEFDDAMNQSLAIMGDVSTAMRTQMADAAREIGKTTRISATEAANSYYYLASAGMNAEQSMAALPVVAQFAQAGMFNMATATDLATDAQSALGLKAEDTATNIKNLQRVTDVLVKANVLANASVEQFSKALTTKAGAAMKGVGMEIEEGVAVLAAFADQGLKAEEAGTALNRVLLDLQSKAIKNSKAFKDYGFSVYDGAGELRNMGDIVADLETALDGMSDKTQKAALMEMGFTDKSIAAMQALLGTSDAIKGYQSELENAAGTTEEVANKQLESFSGKWEVIKGQLTDTAISIGEDLVPKLMEIADWISDHQEDISEGLSAIAEMFLAVADAILIALEAWENFTSVFTNPKGTGDVDYYQSVQELNAKGANIKLPDMTAYIQEEAKKAADNYAEAYGTEMTVNKYALEQRIIEAMTVDPTQSAEDLVEIFTATAESKLGAMRDRLQAAIQRLFSGSWSGITAGLHWGISTGGDGLALGGVASGPRSGYFMKLHGDEAVLPLDDPARSAEVLQASGLWNKLVQMMGGAAVTDLGTSAGAAAGGYGGGGMPAIIFDPHIYLDGQEISRGLGNVTAGAMRSGAR